jgi:opine dehydrogenase
MNTIESGRVAVLGAGHAGRGLAAYLSLYGIDVSLYNRTLEHVIDIRNQGGLDVHGIVNGFAPLSLVTDDMSKAMHNRGILIVTVPAQAHRFFAQNMAPHIENGQLILLMPGRTGGALEYVNFVKDKCDLEEVMIGEAQTFSFVSRISGESSVRISEIKNRVQVSALPATDNYRFLSRLSVLPLPLTSASSVMETSLNNVGAMLHPTPTILCAGLLESRGGGYNHYHDAISESVGRLIEKMDVERVAIAKEFSMYSMSLVDWIKDAYDAGGKSLCECIRNVDAYRGVGSPKSLIHRYVLEDIPTGLVPMSRLATLCGLNTPAIDSVINIACQLYDCNFWHDGRGLTSMGLTDMMPSEVIDFVEIGERPITRTGLEEYWDLYRVEVDDT